MKEKFKTGQLTGSEGDSSVAADEMMQHGQVDEAHFISQTNCCCIHFKVGPEGKKVRHKI